MEDVLEKENLRAGVNRSSGLQISPFYKLASKSFQHNL